MNATRRLWTTLGVIFVLSFAVLGWLGREIYLAAPPYPEVKTATGATLYTAAELKEGQRAWLTAGGQQLGTVWGHGSYVAPDWSADWLHREAVALRDGLAGSASPVSYDSLSESDQAGIGTLLKREMRTNGYDPRTGIIAIDPLRADAFEANVAH